MIRARVSPAAMDVVLPGPENPEPPYGRTAHPYYLYEMIRSQPTAVRETLRATDHLVEGLPPPPRDRALLFVGMGTSFHAARAAAWAAGPAFGYRQPVRAIDSFDLLLEPELVRSAGAAIVFSSSGETALTLRAQDALRAAGVRQVLVTGTEKSRSVERADHVLLTRDAVEKSWVHTVSYTTAISAAEVLLARWSGGTAPDPEGVASALSSLVDREDDWRRLATTVQGRSRFLCLGSGPAEATAREASLKFREGAARFVASSGVEEFLHGTLPSVDPSGTAVIAIATSPLEKRRATEALRAASRAGAESVLLARGPLTAEPIAQFELPELPPAVTPIADILPLQSATYWLALAAGRNPDVMGYDDPRIFAARRTYGI